MFFHWIKNGGGTDTGASFDQWLAQVEEGSAAATDAPGAPEALGEVGGAAHPDADAMARAEAARAKLAVMLDEGS